MEWSNGLGCAGFVPLAFGAGGNVCLFEIPPHVQPVEGVTQHVICFQRAKVTLFVMGKSEEGLTYMFASRDDQAVINEPIAVGLCYVFHACCG